MKLVALSLSIKFPQIFLDIGRSRFGIRWRQLDAEKWYGRGKSTCGSCVEFCWTTSCSFPRAQFRLHRVLSALGV